jgi:ribosomal protein S18 acetylase RimI-like enzyme
MRATIAYSLNNASEVEIAEHLSRCDTEFQPILSGQVNLDTYAQKIASNATRFEAWSDGALVGLVAAYCNDNEKRIAYITSVSVLKAWTGNGIATYLLERCIQHAKTLVMREISLEVAKGNGNAINLYRKCGFIAGKDNSPLIVMTLFLGKSEIT